MQGRKLWLKPREENPALSEGFLPWTRRQLSEAGKGPVMVSRGQSMRRRLLLLARVALVKTGRANEVAGDGVS
jgi:hypothetical protein